MSTIEITPLTAAIGAEVSGVDLREELTDVDVEGRCARRCSTTSCSSSATSRSPTTSSSRSRCASGRCTCRRSQTVHQDAPEIVVLDQVHPQGEGADEWHSDNTFLADPPMGSILRAVQLPAVGGDTCFASMYAAYEGLSPAMRDFVDGLARGPRHHQAAEEGDPRRSLHPRPRRDAGEVPAGRAQRRRSRIPRPVARRCS